MCEIFDKPIHQWIIELFANYLSTKTKDESKKLGYRFILPIVDTIGSSGKTIISQLFSYHLEFSNYLVITYISGAKDTQEILRAVSTNKRSLISLDFVRLILGGHKKSVRHYTKIKRKTKKRIKTKSKEPSEGNKSPCTVKKKDTS